MSRMENSSEDANPITAPPLPLPAEKTLSEAEVQRKLRRDISGFMIFMGVILGLAIWAFSTQVKPEPQRTDGMEIRTLVGWGVGVAAALYIVTGLLFALISHKIFIWLGIAWSVLFLLAYAALFASSGDIPVNPISMLIAAIPVLLWIRGRNFRNVPTER